jgi:hypothetical protein
MWDYYKRTFAAVQLAALLGGYMVYTRTNHALLPPVVIFLSMQVSAVFGAMWANRLRRKIQVAHRA